MLLADAATITLPIWPLGILATVIASLLAVFIGYSNRMTRAEERAATATETMKRLESRIEAVDERARDTEAVATKLEARVAILEPHILRREET